MYLCVCVVCLFLGGFWVGSCRRCACFYAVFPRVCVSLCVNVRVFVLVLCCLQVGSSSTLGAGTVLSGSILASASITAGAGSSVQGSLIAFAAITLDDNKVQPKGYCDSPPPAPPPPLLPPLPPAPVMLPSPPPRPPLAPGMKSFQAGVMVSVSFYAQT